MNGVFTYFTTMPGCIIGALVAINLVAHIGNYVQACRLRREEGEYNLKVLSLKREIDNL